MTTIVTRAGKGSPLTNNEVDANFTNLNDAKIETLTSTDTSVTITGTGSSRNLSVPVNPNVVSGPASATDNAVARFDTTTGKLIQNSSVTIDDNGNAGNVNAITFDTTPATLPTATGSMFWDTGDGVPSVILDADVTLQLGQENIVKVYNNSASTITNGSVVAVNGAQGQRPAVVLADADSEPLSAATLGIATEAIAAGAEGFVCTFGTIRGLDTSTFAAGAPVYLSQTAGQFTATRPNAPAHTVFLGWVIKVNASSGELFVNINNGWELDELHNILITSPASGNTLIYDAPAGVWKNANLIDGTGISITEGAGSITVGLAANYGDTQNPYASKTANNFLAAPNGSAGAPTFRAIVAADIPTLNQNTTGTAANVTGIVAVANGGTGVTTAQAEMNRVAAAVTSGQYLRGNGTNVVMSAIQAADVPTLNQSTTGNAATATNLSTTSANWSTNGVITAVVGQLAWKNYGNSHTIFDASAGTAPNGTAVNNTNAATAWSATYPTLMGWNGSSSYGVRVDSARVADSATTASTANALNSANSYTAVSFTATSDERLKTNWAGLSLDFVALLAGVKHGTFERISDGTRDVGVSAQALQKVIPEAVISDEKGYLSVNYGGAALVAAIELAKVVEELRAEVARLKAKVGE